MDHKIEENEGKTVVKLTGQLIASDREEFDGLINQVFTSGVKTVDLQMTDLTYMDSVGLGMLVTLRDEAEKHDANVDLVDPQGNVKALLEMARFDILFNIR